MVRGFAIAALQSMGCSVIPCADGVEAVATYRRLHESIDLVILDVQMPRMDGQAAFHLIRAVDPNARVLLVSGFSSPDTVESLLDAGAAGILPKPFSLDELASSVGALVRLRGPSANG